MILISAGATCRLWPDRTCFEGTPAKVGGLDGVCLQVNTGLGHVMLAS